VSLIKTKITISKDGNARIEGMEQSDQCYKLVELAKSAGKVISQDKKEHVPVYHDVHQRSN